ncbi:hypothetical protein ACEPAH_8061 [Sanghuangporus vaninii]
MALPSKITLYDVEFTLKEKTLSPYSIRLMLLLGYKNIAYETVWISFPDVEATAKAVNALPTFTKADGTPGYTIPFITASFPDKSTIAISDSLRIAQFIETTYPDPEDKIMPSNARVFQSMFTKYMTERIYGSINKISMPLVISALPESAGKWIVATRKNTIGKTVDEIAPQDETSVTEAWKGIEAAFDDLAAHLDSGGEGNFRVTGSASYAEFELVSVLNFVKRLSPDGWNRLEVRNGGRWGKLMDLPLYKKLVPANRV